MDYASFTLLRSQYFLTLMASIIDTSISETSQIGNVTSHQKCTKCRKTLPLSSFAIARSGDRQGKLLKTCQSCKLKSTTWRKNRDKGEDKGEDKENVSVNVPRVWAEDNDFIGTSEISMEAFLTVLAEQSGSMHVSARVDLTGLKAGDGGMASGKQMADKLAEKIWNETQYRFMYVAS